MISNFALKKKLTMKVTIIFFSAAIKLPKICVSSFSGYNTS